jgi:phage portal protein BeeE
VDHFSDIAKLLEGSGLCVSPFPEAFKCMDILLNVVGDLPLHLYERDTGEIAEGHMLETIFSEAPNQYQMPSEWKSFLMLKLLTYGHALGHILRGPRGNILAIESLAPWRVTIEPDGYSCCWDGGIIEKLSRSYVLHITESPRAGDLFLPRKLSRTDVAMLFGIPPHMLDQEKQDTAGIGFVIYTMRPRLERICAAMERDLLTEAERARFRIAFDVGGLAAQEATNG